MTITNELLADLKEKLSLARLMSETTVKVDVKTLTLLLDNVSVTTDIKEADLETVLENMKNKK